MKENNLTMQTIVKTNPLTHFPQLPNWHLDHSTMTFGAI